MELPDIGPDLFECGGSLVEIAEIAALRVETQIGERCRKHLLRRVEQRDATGGELLRIRRVEDQCEAAYRRLLAKCRVYLFFVEADTGIAPEIRHAMRIARI